MKIFNTKQECIFDVPSAKTIQEMLDKARQEHRRLSYADFRGAGLGGADFSNLEIDRANFEGAYLAKAKFLYATANYANFSNCNLIMADFTNSNCSQVNFVGASLRGAKLSNHSQCANFSTADISQAIVNDNSKEFLSEFKKTRSGIYVYKGFGHTAYTPNPKWNIAPGQYIEEVVNSNRFADCGCGVNFGTMKFVKNTYPKSTIWLCLIEWEDAHSIVVPYGTNGKARCGRLKLIKKVK